ncbi:MAG: KdsC family phosphatase [Desulfonatronovibrionaceae bacterium]
MKASERAEKIELFVLDVDGVLTDGGLYYDSRGRVAKRFDVQDGLGIKLAQAAGIHVAAISGLDSSAVESRVQELGIREYHAGHREKVPLLKDICFRLGVDLENTAYIGDDWVDAGPMLAVGLPMAVANARPEIKGISWWVSASSGGCGAVREAVMFLLECQGKTEGLWRQWAGND